MSRTIIFDLGGVLLDLDFELAFKKMSQVLNVDLQYDALPEKLRKAFIDFELGKIKQEVFLWNLQMMTDKPPHGKPLMDAWNAMLIGFDPARFEMLLRLKKDYKLILLSNTNQIHLDWIYRHLDKEYGIKDWDEEYFGKTYYSHEIGLRKPNADIYEFVINDSRIDPNKAIFIDDSIENIVTANNVGLIGIHHPRNMEIIDVIDDYINRID